MKKEKQRRQASAVCNALPIPAALCGVGAGILLLSVDP